ncbi:hypothetical protein [Streptomyces hundungensis]|uniref:hypothetical protein n=1 Tax=Streptomyces hundungensis TaxID=1077946 RepID=UPI0013C4E510|nr:hypothetical protein [Streptomyces hundungensis]
MDLMAPAAVEIGIWVQYRTRHVRRWSRGKIIGVVYGEPKMKRANITHVVVQDWYSVGKGVQPHDITAPAIIPLHDVRKERS